MDAFVTVLIITTIAGAATGLGALPLLAKARVSHRTYDAALGLAAGVMLAASVFGLILPGMDVGGLSAVIVGVFIGGFALLVANRLFPHVHAHYTGWQAHGPVSTPSDPEQVGRTRKAVLIGGAITLHNAPEGLAIGVAFASGLEEVALVLAVIIAIQNVPDGFAFAVPLSDTGLSTTTVVLYTTLSGLVPQVIAASAGFLVVAVATGLFPIAAGFAAGAMMAVIFREMIPASHGHGYADAATTAFLVGFAIILVVEGFT